MGTDYWNTAKGQYDLKRMIREDEENKKCIVYFKNDTKINSVF